MGQVDEFTCASCGYAVEAHHGPTFTAVSELRECLDCEEIVGVCRDLQDRPARGMTPTREAELLATLNRCPKCDGTRHIAVRRVGPGFRKGVRCPRCGERLRCTMTARTD